MKKMLLSIGSQVILLFCCQETLVAAAADTTNAQQGLPSGIDSNLCTKEILRTLFPPPIVKAVLIRYGVSEQNADSIAKVLSQKDQEVAKLVEEKAAKLSPNPLNDVTQRDEAVKIFEETLYEVFAKVLKSSKVEADDNQIQTLLDNIRELKGRLFVECIKQERQTELHRSTTEK